jgi:hypothetical protein
MTKALLDDKREHAPVADTFLVVDGGHINDRIDLLENHCSDGQCKLNPSSKPSSLNKTSGKRDGNKQSCYEEIYEIIEVSAVASCDDKLCAFGLGTVLINPCRVFSSLHSC